MAKTLKDFKQQQKNANKHTERGMDMLEKSMQQVGYTAPIIVANDGEAISGSARHEAAANVFGADSEPIVVKSDGTRPIVVVRTDVPNAQSAKAKQIAVLENRVAEINLAWEPAVMQELVEEMPEFIATQFTEKELQVVMDEAFEESQLADEQQITSQWVVAITCESEA